MLNKVLRPSWVYSSIFVAMASALVGTIGEAGAAGKPIRIVCPAPPGGGVDFACRAIGDPLANRAGQPVVVDNRPGASGAIGAQIVASALPDGNTLLLASSSTIAANPAIQRQSYQTAMKDFAPVSMVSRIPYVLVVHPSVAAKSVAELIRLAKSQPGRLNYASSAGAGSGSGLAMELFKMMASIDVVHIPYKGSAMATTELIGGQVQTGFFNVIPVLPHVKTGKLRALGLSGPVRSPVMPEIPTIAESGLPGYDALQWYGVLVPARTPRAIVNHLQQEIVTILQQADTRERLTREGGDVIGSTPEQFAKHIESEILKWTKVVNTANIRAE